MRNAAKSGPVDFVVLTFSGLMDMIETNEKIVIYM